MRVNLNTFEELDRPCYVLEEKRLRRNLQLISSVARDAGVEIILAFKAYALWKTFPIFREYISATTASSLCEARLACDEFGSKAHTFSPAYTDYEIDEIARCSSHLTFNSLSQYGRLYARAMAANPSLSVGLRVNPEYSEVGTPLYNPCAPGTRFGVSADKLPERLPEGIDGFHCHCHCESGADVFVRTLGHITDKFSKWFDQIKWINFGGGHHITKDGYDIGLLEESILYAKKKWGVEVYLEPGEAVALNAGYLVSRVIDVVENSGIKIAVLDASAACHMPDVIEMPYTPPLYQASNDENGHSYRLAGPTCLAGDVIGDYKTESKLNPGDLLLFGDMAIYTTCKNNTFNGMPLPGIYKLDKDGDFTALAEFGYDDFKRRLGK